MAQLLVNFSAINNLKSNIKGAMDCLEGRKDAINDVKRGVGNVGTSRGYLGSAINELYSKNKAIDKKIDKLSGLRDELTAFAEFADETDQKVANRIKSETESFCYSAGIGKAKSWLEQAFENACNWVAGVVDDVVDWYEENKEAIGAFFNILVDGLFLVLAVVAFIATLPASGFFAICCAIAAGFMLAKSAADFITSGVSFYYYCTGDKKDGAIWAERGLRDGFLYIGREIDKATGLNVFEDIASFLYTGLEVFSAVVGVMQLGKTIAKSFKADGLAWFKKYKYVKDSSGNLSKVWVHDGIFQRTWSQNKAWFKSIDWGKRFKDGKNWGNLFLNLVGIKGPTIKGGNSFRNNFRLLFNNFGSDSMVNKLYKFKVYGSIGKMCYKTVEDVFNGKAFYGEIKVVKTYTDFSQKVLGLP